MAKSKRKKPENLSPRIANRRAFHDYTITDKLECGIQLLGSEVKSVRHGKVSLQEGYATVEPENNALWLKQVDIAPYPQAGVDAHAPKRDRKLLAHKHEIQRLAGATAGKGVTLVPLALYFQHGVVKVEIGVAHGKKAPATRRDTKKKAMARELQRAMTRKRL